MVAEPHPLVLDKSATRIDEVAARFIGAATLTFLGTVGPSGSVTVTPRGTPAADGARILDGGRQLALPERPGNRRLDSLRNLLVRPGVGLTFCVPRLDHVLRVNGHGRVVRDPEVLGLWPDPPQLAIVLDVEETFVHCGRALRTSGAWRPEDWADPAGIPGSKELSGAARATRD
nr:pyridoxamine 5'-phosphate oxidase family protein [Pseudonocardia autotrophica]